MKILHVADTHLGYSAYRKTTEEGINQREMDTYDAFKQVIDYAVKSKPSLILHAGDLFDSVRPTNRAITFAIKQLLRLSRQDIPLVLIAGNHEQPKLKETGHIFTIFDHIQHVYPIYGSSYETRVFNINNKKVTIHALPQCQTKQQFNESLKKLKTDSSSHYNILLTHGSVKGIKEFSMNEFNERVIPVQSLKPRTDFNYIALGHYHKYKKIHENAFYAGSTERFSFADAGEQKGFIELDLKEKLTPRFINIPNRSMFDIDPLDCSHLALGEIMNKIIKNIQSIEPNGKIFRIILKNIPKHIYRGIDFSTIRELSTGAIHFEIKANVTKEGELKLPYRSNIDALAHEYERYLQNQSIKEKKILLKLGLEYIDRIVSKDLEK